MDHPKKSIEQMTASELLVLLKSEAAGCGCSVELESVGGLRVRAPAHFHFPSGFHSIQYFRCELGGDDAADGLRTVIERFRQESPSIRECSPGCICRKVSSDPDEEWFPS